MVHSIEAYCFGLPSNRNGFIRFQFNSSSSLVNIEFRVRSETKSSSSRKQAHEILMTVTIFFTTLTPNGLTRQITMLRIASWGQFNKTFTRVIYKCSHSFRFSKRQ